MNCHSPNFRGFILMKNALNNQVGMRGDMFLWLVANLKQGVIYFIKQACGNEIMPSVYVYICLHFFWCPLWHQTKSNCCHHCVLFFKINVLPPTVALILAYWPSWNNDVVFLSPISCFKLKMIKQDLTGFVHKNNATPVCT